MKLQKSTVKEIFSVFLDDKDRSIKIKNFNWHFYLMILSAKHYFEEAKRELKFVVGFLGTLGLAGSIAGMLLKNEEVGILSEKEEQQSTQNIEQRERVEYINPCATWKKEKQGNQRSVSNLCDDE